MAFEWDRLGQPNFDRRIEALLYHAYSGSEVEINVVNGRGGDAGIDVLIRRPAGKHIFQLKYFPEGFSGPWIKRRSQITDSFRAALQHDPVEWTLVVPCTLSPSDWKFIRKLGTDQAVKITVWDRAALDSRFATHPELEAAFQRDLLREAARDYGVESALLLHPDDLITRVRALGVRADEVDPHWGMDFHRHGDTVVRSLRAKHPLAHLASPIQLQLTGRLGPEHAGLDAAINRSLGFGIAEEVLLPSEAVESLTIDGPAWIAGTLDSPEVIWRPQPVSGARVGAPVKVAFHSEGGATAATYRGRLRTLGAGSIGASIDADIHGGQLQIMLPYDTDRTPKLRYTFDLEGREPAEASKIIGLYLRLQQGGDFSITVDGVPAGCGTVAPAVTSHELQEAARLKLYLEDLDAVQRHCENYFAAPLDIPTSERIRVRIARLIVEGRCVVYPYLRDITFTLNGTDQPAMQELLSGAPRCLRISPPQWTISVGGHTLDIGPVHFFHTQLRPDDGPRTLAALRAGRGAGLRVTLRPADGTRFRIYHAGPHLAADRPLEPSPLGLDGYPEPT